MRRGGPLERVTTLGCVPRRMTCTMLKHRWFEGAFAAALLLLSGVALPGPAHAEEYPTFAPGMHIRRATDVAVVSEGEAMDGTVEVLDVWRGGLEVGSQVRVGGLAAFVAGPEATLHRGGRELGRANFQRLILFLSRDGEKFVPSLWDIGTCLVIIERGEAFAMRQPESPGPRMLLPLREMDGGRRDGYDESALRAMVERHDLLHRQLAEALQNVDVPSRVAALEPLCLESWVAEEATSELARIGKPALGALWRLYRETPPVAHFRFTWLQDIIQVGGREEAPRLLRLLHDEVAFWRGRAPGLKTMWWAGHEPELNVRYGILQELVRTFATWETLDARPDVLALEATATEYPLFGGEEHPNNGYRVANEVSQYLEKVGR